MQVGWTAEATSLDMGQEEEGVQQPTPFLPDPQLALPQVGLGRSCQQGSPQPQMVGGAACASAQPPWTQWVLSAS